MGALLGLSSGLGLLLIAWSVTGEQRDPSRSSPIRRWHARTAVVLTEAGLGRLSVAGVVAWALAGGVLTFICALGVSRSVAVATSFGLIATYLPAVVIGSRRRRRLDALRDAWPDVVDGLASAIGAGLALPEALIQLATRGPEQLRPAFELFTHTYRATGRFGPSLDLLKQSLADPVGDRVIEALRLAREVGGNDLGRLLRTLSRFLRDDARTRRELVARQAWTINGARLAVAAPWLLLAMISTRPQAVRAYDTPAGLLVLAGGGAACVVAYRVMMRIGRLPAEQRVLG